ncbi:hypothetical protein AVEN_230915-1 [Araneus ventricosus]|uniref:SCAN box domain-containing protein n=1 Tax=Araneus ventricosus TaxID=182803 RepID=A0A4Y2A4X0_ARAVE|nr:hypothetical protein AVEN_230915-1 [Araneus ventricosus]
MPQLLFHCSYEEETFEEFLSDQLIEDRLPGTNLSDDEEECEELFERQTKWTQIDKKDWVCHLLGLLPYDITQLIAREPTDKVEDYEHVKSLLLKKFKLSPEKFRQKFLKHQRGIESNWTDFAYEMENSFREWITGLGVQTFEQLIGLMVTDKIKRRVSADIQSHFIDEWSNIIPANELCKKLDAYEEVRGKSVLRKIDQY